MINKKSLIKVFIIFFIINLFYLIFCKSYAASVTTSYTGGTLELEVGETKYVKVTAEPPSLGTHLSIGTGSIKNESLGVVSTSNKIIYSDEKQITWMVGIKGTSEGSVKLTCFVGNESAQPIVVKIKNSAKAQNPSSGTTGNKSNTVLVDTDILREDFANEFDPNSKTGGYNISQPVIKVIIPVVSRVLSILQIIGAIVLVLSLALAGFNGVLGAGDGFSEDLDLNVSTSVNEYGNEVSGVQNLTPGALSKIIRRALIGSIILESSLTIVKIVFNICTSL